MEIEKDNFEDDNELSRLEDDEELAGEKMTRSWRAKRRRSSKPRKRSW